MTGHVRYAFVAVLCVFLPGTCSHPADVAKTDSAAPKSSTPSAPPARTRLKFTEVTAETGIYFIPVNGQEHAFLSIIETVGTGVALFDYDADGRLDLFACGGGTFDKTARPVGSPAALFKNDGDLKLSAVATSARLPFVPFYSHGAIAGDFDNDGFTDVLITGYGGLLLWQNNGDGTFSDVSPTCGLKSREWNTAAGWGDLNGDGNLDLYVARYVKWSFKNNPRCPQFGERDVCPPEKFASVSDLLFFSNGDGTFRDGTKEAGLVPGGNGLGVVLGDIDRDGDLDIYVANDATQNFLYLNDGAGHLKESAERAGVAFGEHSNPDGSMGIALGDFNNDGRPDLWVTNFERQLFALYRNETGTTFEHASERVGIGKNGRDYVGFGTVLFDADLDGDEDIFVANGHVRRHPSSGHVRQLPLLLENRGEDGFENVASLAGPYLKSPHMGRGVAMGDLDGDGDPDLVVCHTNEPISVLRNDSDSQRIVLSVRLIGTKSPRDAVGATITIRYPGGQQMRQIKGGESYLSTNSPIAVFGLGPHRTIDELQVRWPSGKTDRLPVPAHRRTVTVLERH